MSYDERWDKAQAAMAAAERECAYQRQRAADDRYRREQSEKQECAQRLANAAHAAEQRGYTEKAAADRAAAQKRQEEEVTNALRTQKNVFDAMCGPRYPTHGGVGYTPQQSATAMRARAFQSASQLRQPYFDSPPARRRGGAVRWMKRTIAQLLIIPAAMGAFFGFVDAWQAANTPGLKHQQQAESALVGGLVCLVITLWLRRVIRKNAKKA